MKLVKTELSEADKYCLTLWVQTANASHSINTAYPGRYPDSKTATRAMKNLLERPLAHEFEKSLRTEIITKTELTKDWIVEETKKIIMEARGNMDSSSAIKGMFLLAKIGGFMTSKTVIDVKKSININFGGNFNPDEYIDEETGKLNPYHESEKIDFVELPKIQIESKQDPNDNARLDDY